MKNSYDQELSEWQMKKINIIRIVEHGSLKRKSRQSTEDDILPTEQEVPGQNSYTYHFCSLSGRGMGEYSSEN